MIQFNISLFVEPGVEQDATMALTKIIMPELKKFEGIQHIHLLSINSHQEPDSKGLSLQFWIEQSLASDTSKEIEEVVSAFFHAEFPNKFVYFSSQLTLIQTN